MSGLSLSVASTSTVIVSKVSSKTCLLPRTFFIADLDRPINHSQNPSNQGALFGMNRHETLLLPSSSLTVGDSIREHSSDAADRQVEPLSDIMIVGSDLLPANLRKAIKNVSALDYLHVDGTCSGTSEETQIYLDLLLALLYIQGPSEIHSCKCEWVDVLCSQLRQRRRVRRSIWSSIHLVACDTVM